MKIIMVLLLLAYIVSPVDFLPDALPMVGTLDDATAGMLIVKLLTVRKGGRR